MRTGLFPLFLPGTGRCLQRRQPFEQLVQRRRIIPHPDPGRVVDRIGHGSTRAADPQFADPLCVERVGMGIAIVEEHDVDGGISACAGT